MQVDTFSQIVGRVLLRVPNASRFLAEDWVRNAFRRVSERRRWSWLYSFGQFLIPQSYNTGTVTVTRSSLTVTGSGTSFTSDMIGRQFRIASSPIYTIKSVDSITQLTLDNVYGGDTATAQTYEIYLAYVTPPVDFHAFITVFDPHFDWQLALNYSQNEINSADAQRSNAGNAYLLAWLDYSSDSVGIVAQPIQVLGSGPSPGSSGIFTGPVDSLFVVEITTGGIAGTAIFRWKKGSGAYTSNVTTDVDGLAQSLSDGVQVYFPTGQTYVLGDLFIIQTLARSNPGLPRYELWPHQKAQYVYPFLYEKRAPDISDPNVVLPRFIRGDLLLEYALAEAASWPGPSTDRPNPYYRLELHDRHLKKAEFMCMELERQDEEVFLADVYYQDAVGLPFAPIPALGDSNWLMKHDL